MSTKYPILRSLDPYHQRIGYLNVVSLAANRGLDSRDALAARFQKQVFERIYRNDPRWPKLYGRADETCQREIDAKAAKANDDDPAAILLRNKATTGWVYAQDLWIRDTRMPSHLGTLTLEEDKLNRPLELAKWIELILPTYELSEDGVIVRALLDRVEAESPDAFNPMLVAGLPMLQLLYLRLLLRSEILFPHLLREFVRAADSKRLFTRGPNALLRAAVESLLVAVGTPASPADILEMQQILEFKDALLKSESTEENYLRPRMEILVDLGLINRGPNQGKFVWSETDITRRCAEEWAPLADMTESVTSYLDTRFFSSMATVFGRPVVPLEAETAMLNRFAAAFPVVGREFGFTPARSVTTVACLQSWANGEILEIDDVFETVQAAAASPLGQHLHFSGGSRFDKEFLIRVDPALVSASSTQDGE